MNTLLLCEHTTHFSFHLSCYMQRGFEAATKLAGSHTPWSAEVQRTHTGTLRKLRF